MRVPSITAVQRYAHLERDARQAGRDLGAEAVLEGNLRRLNKQGAVELDSTIAEAHAVLAKLSVHFDWDVEASDRASRRALALGPTDPFVLHCYSLR